MTIINMPYSDKGRDEHDRIFGGKKAEPGMNITVKTTGSKKVYVCGCGFRGSKIEAVKHRCKQKGVRYE